MNLLDLIPGGGLTAILAAVIAAVGGVLAIMFKSERAGVNKQKAKEAEARAKNLEKIKRAADARDAVRPSDSVLNDPRNRDRR